MPRITFTANDHDVHGKPLRYLGGMLGTTVTRDFRADLTDAVHADHPCENDSSCDIREAREQGYIYVAAHQLMDATETPHVDRVIAAHRFNRTLPAEFGNDMYDNADWDGWKQHFYNNVRMCPSCEASNFEVSAGDNCGNCHAILGYRVGDEVEYYAADIDPDKYIPGSDSIEAKVTEYKWDDTVRSEPIQWLTLDNGDTIRSDYLLDTYFN